MTPSLSLPRKRYEDQKPSIVYSMLQIKDGLVVNICI